MSRSRGVRSSAALRLLERGVHARAGHGAQKNVQPVVFVNRATIGEVGNSEHELIKIGKAGRNRWKGVKPQTRGVAMNPVDHPLGGGEGKTSGGRHPVSPWGKPEGRTRDKTKPSQKLIVRRRRTRGSRR